jgi:hypothetical protein
MGKGRKEEKKIQPLSSFWHYTSSEGEKWVTHIVFKCHISPAGAPDLCSCITTENHIKYFPVAFISSPKDQTCLHFYSKPCACVH